MSSVLYEPHERPPYPLAFGLSFQRAMIMGPGLVLIPTIVMRAANQDESYLLWTIFALLMVNGLITIVQTLGLGRFGSGYVLVMGSTSAFIGVCVTALTEGGPSLLASLIVTAALFQFALASRLSLLRRFITPVVAGTVLALIPVTVMPAIFRLMTNVPDGTPGVAAPLSAAVTFVHGRGALAPRLRDVATLGAADWGDGRLCGGRVVRPVRCEPDPGRSLDWPAGQLLAGAGPELWSRLLVHPADFTVLDPDRNDRDPQPCRGRAAGLVAPAAGHRPARRPGCGDRRQPG